MDGVIRVLASTLFLFAIVSVFVVLMLAERFLTGDFMWTSGLAAPVSLAMTVIFYSRFPSIAVRLRWIQRFPAAHELGGRASRLRSHWIARGHGRVAKGIVLQIAMIACALALPVCTLFLNDPAVLTNGLPQALRVYLITAGLLLLFVNRLGALRLCVPGLWYSDSHWVRNRMIAFLAIVIVSGVTSMVASLI